MNREELINTIEILRIQPKDEKGFSFRRTIKTLQQAERMRAVDEYYTELLKALGGIEDD